MLLPARRLQFKAKLKPEQATWQCHLVNETRSMSASFIFMRSRPQDDKLESIHGACFWRGHARVYLCSSSHESMSLLNDLIITPALGTNSFRGTKRVLTSCEGLMSRRRDCMCLSEGRGRPHSAAILPNYGPKYRALHSFYHGCTFSTISLDAIACARFLVVSSLG